MRKSHFIKTEKELVTTKEKKLRHTLGNVFIYISIFSQLVYLETHNTSSETYIVGRSQTTLSFILLLLELILF